MNAYLKNIIFVFVALLFCNIPTYQFAFGRSSTQLGSVFHCPPEEIYWDNITTHNIATYSSVAWYESFNFYGDLTTANNVYSAAEGMGYTHSIAFYIGEGGTDWSWGEQYWFIAADDGSKIYDRDIYPHSSGREVKLAFLWSCEQAEVIGGIHWSGIPFGMPHAWTHDDSLSSDGYAQPDDQDRVFLGFSGIIYGLADLFHGPELREFVNSFYYAALCNGASYSAKNALDYASNNAFHLPTFADTWLYQGWWQTRWEDGHFVNYTSQMKVYGNSNIHVSIAMPYCAMKTKSDGFFYIPNTITRFIKIDELFDGGNLTGDQTGGLPPYSSVSNWPDGKVDIRDISFINSKFGKHEGDNGWDYMADLYPDRKIDIRDVSSAAKSFGQVGSYIANLTGVTVAFRLSSNATQEVTPDIDGFVQIPADSVDFTVKRNGASIGAVVVFWRS